MILTRCPSCEELAFEIEAAWCLESGKLDCPYHNKWIRMHSEYRTCPECSYCIHCKIRGRPVFWPHTHGKYQLHPSQVMV